VGAGKKALDGVPVLECSPPARRRCAAAEVDGSDESLLSEEIAAEAAWPRSKTAVGGRARGTGTGTDRELAESWR